MHFIPASPKGDVRLLDEALGIAMLGHPLVPMAPYEHEDGQTIDMSRIGRNLTMVGWRSVMSAVLESIHVGLKGAEIEVLVQDRETNLFYRVPRIYWFHHEPTTSVLELNPDEPRYLPHLNGQPFIVDISQEKSWKKAAYPALQKDRPSSSANENRGTLPAHATNADRRNEDAAHAAAESVRSGSSLESAAKATAHMLESGNRKPESIVAGIRRAYNLMYDKRGKPI